MHGRVVGYAARRVKSRRHHGLPHWNTSTTSQLSWRKLCLTSRCSWNEIPASWGCSQLEHLWSIVQLLWRTISCGLSAQSMCSSKLQAMMMGFGSASAASRTSVRCVTGHTLFCLLNCDGSAQRGAAVHDGTGLSADRRGKEATCPERARPRVRARLVVLAGEVVERWSEETSVILRLLAKARTLSGPLLMRCRADWLLLVFLYLDLLPPSAAPKKEKPCPRRGSAPFAIQSRRAIRSVSCFEHVSLPTLPCRCQLADPDTTDARGGEDAQSGHCAELI